MPATKSPSGRRPAEPATPLSQQLDVAGVATLLGVRERLVRELVQRGEIPFSRVGPRLLRFDPVRIAAWLEERENVAYDS